MKVEWRDKGKIKTSDIPDDFFIWLAGFWEGEGWLTYSEGKKEKGRGVSLTLGIAQRRKEVIDYLHNTTKLGTVYRSHKKGDINHFGGEMWTWIVCDGYNVKKIVEYMNPHLRFRKAECEEKIMKWQTARLTFKNKSWTPEEIHKLDNEYNSARFWGYKDDGIFAAKVNRLTRAITTERMKLGLVGKGSSNSRLKQIPKWREEEEITAEQKEVEAVNTGE